MQPKALRFIPFVHHPNIIARLKVAAEITSTSRRRGAHTRLRQHQNGRLRQRLETYAPVSDGRSRDDLHTFALLGLEPLNLRFINANP